MRGVGGLLEGKVGEVGRDSASINPTPTTISPAQVLW